MRRLILALVVALVVPGYAQEITLSSPVARTSEAKYTVRKFNVDATGTPQATIEVSVQDSGGVEIRYFNVSVPSTACGSATVAGIFTALDTVRVNETGGVLKRANYRLLGYLSDNGCGFPAHTLAP